jgi:uncharacterized protein (DUF305 family)
MYHLYVLRFRSTRAATLVVSALALSCRSAEMQPTAKIIQPGAPGQASREIQPSQATDFSQIRITEADVKFMQGMIGHHEQAVEMVALMPDRTARPEMKMLGRRIDESQTDEIKMMEHWLQARGQSLPDPHAHHMHGATLMPGMLTEEQMAQLTAAKGAEFDRLFLQFMIQHHQGALIMVKDLFAAKGAAQDSEIFAFATDVDADQTAEIQRMAAMLSEFRQ